MAELTVGMTYGNALYQVAEEVNKVDLILKEGYSVLEVFDREGDLFAFFNDPTISAAEKKHAMNNVFEGRICEELLNLLCILVDKGRSRHFERIMKAYRALVDKAEGCAYGKVYSVEPLGKAQMDKLQEETGRLIKGKVVLENEIDDSLIGGVKILIDGKIIDASIRTRLSDLGNTIK